MWRFQSYQEPGPFLAELAEGLRRARLFAEGGDWKALPERPAIKVDGGEVTSLPAPGDAVPAGLVRHGDDLVVAQGPVLYRLDPATGEVRGKAALKLTPQDLTSDGEHLYAVTAGWTSGEGIVELDPATGGVVRTLPNPDREGGRTGTARGLAWRDGRLYVGEIYGQVHVVDPGTGKVLATHASNKRWVFGLAWDGAHFLTVSRERFYLLDPETFAVVREVPVNRNLRAGTWTGGRYLLMEQPVPGFGPEHEPIQVFPRPGKTPIWSVELAPARR
ncbi:MAG: PQQ-binding-like beta-propeller repeat protein [Planctomycetota bacterium]